MKAVLSLAVIGLAYGSEDNELFASGLGSKIKSGASSTYHHVKDFANKVAKENRRNHSPLGLNRNRNLFDDVEEESYDDKFFGTNIKDKVKTGVSKAYNGVKNFAKKVAEEKRRNPSPLSSMIRDRNKNKYHFDDAEEDNEFAVNIKNTMNRVKENIKNGKYKENRHHDISIKYDELNDDSLFDLGDILKRGVEAYKHAKESAPVKQTFDLRSHHSAKPRRIEFDDEEENVLADFGAILKEGLKMYQHGKENLPGKHRFGQAKSINHMKVKQIEQDDQF
jgi:hypothetical protein